MSIKLMAQVFDLPKEVVNSNEKLVLLALADRADEDGHCYPGVDYLSRKTCLSARTVIRVLKNLQAKKLLRRNERRRHYKRTSNEYWIDLYDSLSHSQCDNLTHSQSDTVSPNTSVKIHQSDSSEGGDKSPPQDSESDMVLGGEKSPLKGKKKTTSNALKGFLSDEKQKVTTDTLLKQFGAQRLTGGVLARFWRRIIPLHHPDYGTINELKAKEQGQLVQIRKLLGKDVLPVMAHAIENWIDFTKFAESQHGAFKSPLKPTIAYLLMNAQAARSYHEKETDQPELQSIAIKKGKHHNIVKSIEDTEKVETEKPMTLEELKEIEQGG